MHEYDTRTELYDFLARFDETNARANTSLAKRNIGWMECLSKFI